MGGNGAWSSQVVVASQVIIEGTSDFLLVYNGTPAFGNLIASIAPTGGGTDVYGNTYPGGINSQSGSLNGDIFALMFQGALALGQIVAGVQDITNAIQIGSSPSSGILTLRSGLIATAQAAGFMTLSPGQNTTIPDATSAQARFQAAAAAAAIRVQAIGAFIGGDPVNGVATWQAPAYNANWAGSTTFNGQTGQQTLQWRRTNEDRIAIDGCAQASTGAAGIPFVLPAGFLPAFSQMIPAIQFDPTSNKVITGFCRIDSNGNVVMSVAEGFASIVNGTQIWISGDFPIGNIP